MKKGRKGHFAFEREVVRVRFEEVSGGGVESRGESQCVDDIIGILSMGTEKGKRIESRGE